MTSQYLIDFRCFQYIFVIYGIFLYFTSLLTSLQEYFNGGDILGRKICFITRPKFFLLLKITKAWWMCSSIITFVSSKFINITFPWILRVFMRSANERAQLLHIWNYKRSRICIYSALFEHSHCIHIFCQNQKWWYDLYMKYIKMIKQQTDVDNR